MYGAVTSFGPADPSPATGQLLSADAEPQEEKNALDNGRCLQLLGIFAMVFSSLSNSGQAAAVKMAGIEGCQPLVVATVRFLIQIVVASCSLGGIISPARDLMDVGHSRRFWIVTRAVAGCLSFGTLSLTLDSMAVGEATMIKYTSPVLTCVLARFMLDESWGWPESAALLACMGGVALVAKAGASTSADERQAGGLDYRLAVALGLCGALASAVRNISLKKLGKATEASGAQSAATAALQADLMTWLTGLAGVVMCGAFALVLEGPRAFAALGSPVCLMWVMVVGATGYLMQWSFNWGGQYGTAVLNALLLYLEVVFCLIWQVVAFREPLQFGVVIGAALALLSVVLLTVQKMSRS